MEKGITFEVLFNSNSLREKKFEDFSQITLALKKVIIVVINLALRGKPKDTLKWLKDHKVIIESTRYNEKFIHEVIRHWKISGK